MNEDKVTSVDQIVINGEKPKVLGKKVKVYQTEEFKGKSLNEIVRVALEAKNEQQSRSSSGES